MSNVFTAVVNLCADPAPLTIGDKEAMKLRLADNTGRKNGARFFGMLVTGSDVEKATRLRSGDKIVVSGQLVVNEFTAKKAGKGYKKGDKLKGDEMPYGRILEVIKSDTYFADTDTPTDAPEGKPADDSDVEDPLADL